MVVIHFIERESLNRFVAGPERGTYPKSEPEYKNGVCMRNVTSQPMYDTEKNIQNEQNMIKAEKS